MKKKEVIFLIIILIVQSLIYVITGINKQYIHMDEAYSLGLASYDKVEIQDNEDFYDTWHEGEYYEDYLAVNDDEVGKYDQVYTNQKNDVHPPIYYLLLRIGMGFSKNNYSKWPGIILNIIIYAFITIFMYLILKKLLKNQENVAIKSLILAFISSITMASLTSVIYIRMYALSTLNVLITTYLHLKLYEEKLNYKLLIGIELSALVGSLTHYYYIFYLAMLYLVFAVKYLKNKEYKNLGWYTLTMGIAAGLSLAIFPYSIQHMFFGYRGQGVLSKLLDIKMFMVNIGCYLAKLNKFAGNGLLVVILLAIILLFVVNKKLKKSSIELKEMFLIVILPTLFYFFLVAVASPWIELRYIMPICSLVFVIFIILLYQLLMKLFDEKISNIVMIIVFGLVLIAPFILRIEPEVAYLDKKEIVKELGGDLNLPTIYLFNSEQNRFLDDILLFAKLNNSYIAKDINCTEENIINIFENKDISKGVIVFINPEQENDVLIDIIKNAINLESVKYLKRLNACDVYYVY